MNFIKLPSGSRLNTAHIIRVKQSDDPDQIELILTDEPTPWLETMTLEELDALLSPASSPIVEAVVNLDRLREGAGCCFTYEGLNRHGIIQEIHSGSVEPNIFVLSQGERFQVMPKSGISCCLGEP